MGLATRPLRPPNAHDITVEQQQQQQQQQQLSLLSQASWGRLEMKPTRNKGSRNTKHKNTKEQKKKEKIKFQAH